MTAEAQSTGKETLHAKRPMSSDSDFAKAKASILAAHPTRSSLLQALSTAESRLDRDIRAARAQRERADKEIERIIEEREMGRHLWGKAIEKLEGTQGAEARAEYERRINQKEELRQVEEMTDDKMEE